MLRMLRIGKHSEESLVTHPRPVPEEPASCEVHLGQQGHIHAGTPIGL